jgi:hypothetical protein
MISGISQIRTSFNGTVKKSVTKQTEKISFKSLLSDEFSTKNSMKVKAQAISSLLKLESDPENPRLKGGLFNPISVVASDLLLTPRQVIEWKEEFLIAEKLIQQKNPKFKLLPALEALGKIKDLEEQIKDVVPKVALDYKVMPNDLEKWKTQLLNELSR